MTGALCTLAARSLCDVKGAPRSTRARHYPPPDAAHRVPAAVCEPPRDPIRPVIGFFPYHLQRGGEPLGNAAPGITVRHGVLPLDRLDPIDQSTSRAGPLPLAASAIWLRSTAWIAGIVMTLSPSLTVTGR